MNLQHDKTLDIATGSGRKTKSWKNGPTLWSDLVARLSTTTRTQETVAEYKAMGRDRQSEIKDVGGFVGGYCNNGSRSDIAHRSILCLDADFADADLWPDWELIFGCAAVAYSTHKHTPEKPRLRLVIPLSRNVDPDEYQAIGRRVASVLGIDKFDDTSYQPQRMMYWPSTSRDGEYYFQLLDGPFLDADQELATYHNWRDVSSWPMSSRVAEVVKRTAAKQKDPLEKGGMVGAFCRAYDIHEAIAEFVPTYTPCTDPGRYTFTEGSTAAGVVTYDDKYSYSHHATDPASGQLCNAWDLVRLHHFGVLDADTDPDTPATKRPSYRAMVQLATDDKRVRAQLVTDRQAEAAEDFAEPVPEGIPGDSTGPGWKGLLKITEKGLIAQTIENVVLILRNDPSLAGSVALDEMANEVVTLRPLPWRKDAGQWTDADDAALRFYLERVYGISSKDKIFDAVNVVATENRFHPVRDYLAACEWDGVPRVETLLVDYMGADDTEYTRTVTRKVMAAAVARVYRPGIKFDYMLTLRGAQGLGKSSFIGLLGGRWFSDTLTTVQGKEAYEQLQGVWVMEVGELAGMRKAEVEAIKLFLSKRSDRFRPAYGRRTQEFPRQCIFVGSTNETQFLRDATGNRRFWVVDTNRKPPKDFWAELTPETVRKVWAEAVHLYRQGEPLFLDARMEAEARKIQDAYTEENPKAGRVVDYLDRLLPEDWETRDLYARRAWLESGAEGTVCRTSVCTSEIWAEALGGNPDKFDRLAVAELGNIMASLPGWKRGSTQQKRFPLYGKQRYFERE